MRDNRAIDEAMMRRALDLARQGIGHVEPNPAVGAVIANDRGDVLGEGWHQRFGGPHAEIHALAAAGDTARGACLYVTLEPCSHFGKTPPCSRAVIAAGLRRVVISTEDPATHGSVRGIDELKSAGIEVEVGLMRDEGQQLIAPFHFLVKTGMPWVHAKWAMTLDGKIATAQGSSQWITNPPSRAVVHQLRGRMDAIVTGIGTVLADDPLLTARPGGPRIASRIVLDSTCQISCDSQLVRTVGSGPVMVVTTDIAPQDKVKKLQEAGVEVLSIQANASGQPMLRELLRELGKRRMTNVLVEAGSRVLGSFFDMNLVNEIHAFVAPLLVGGSNAPSPIGGLGVSQMQLARRLDQRSVQILDGDVYVHGVIS